MTRNLRWSACLALVVLEVTALLAVAQRRAASLTVEQILDDLESPSRATRIRAVEAIQTYGRSAREMAPILHDLLRDSTDQAFNQAVALTLVRVGDPRPFDTVRTLVLDEERSRFDGKARTYPSYLDQRPAAVRHLTALLNDPDPGIRRQSAQILARIGSPAATAAKALRKALADPSAEVRLAAADALARVDASQAQPAIRTAVRVVADASVVETRERRGLPTVLETLGRIVKPRPKEAVPLFLSALNHPDAEVRARVARAFVRTLPKSSRAALEKAVADDTGAVRAAAALGLGELDRGREAPETVKLLKRLLRDKEAPVRLAAAEALTRLAGDPGPAITELAQQLETGEAAARRQSARLLGRLGPKAAQATDALVRSLKAADPECRRSAALALLRVEPRHAAAAAQQLVEDLTKADEPGRREAWAGLSQAGAAGIPALRTALDHPESCWPAANLLLRLAPSEASRVATAVTALLSEPRESPTQLEVILFLSRLSTKAQPALPALRKLFAQTSDAALRYPILEAIIRIDSEGRRDELAILRNGLRQAAHDEIDEVRGALEVLARLGPLAADAVPDLLPLLDDQRFVHETLGVLQAIGPGAKAAIPRLKQLVRDPRGHVRYAARSALAVIGSAPAG